MMRDGTYKVDRSKRPSSIDLTVDGQSLKGIFVVREDTLTLCVAEPSEARPTTFATPAARAVTLLVLRRTNP